MNTSELNAFCKSVYDNTDKVGLPFHDDFSFLIEKTIDVYEAESPEYRPYNSEKMPGGFLDFTTGKEVPVIVVPDLHARPYFFKNILQYQLPHDFTGIEESLTVFDALDKNLIHVVCVGDALHSEMAGFYRWKKAFLEYSRHSYTGSNMQQEMKDGFELIRYIFQSKIRWPSIFHFLKGNHENIQNKETGGDHPFCKFANEGDMVKRFVIEWYGEDILYLYSAFENLLPFVYASGHCVVSHAEPLNSYSSDEIINALLNPFVIHGLTWTSNGTAEEGSVAQMLKNLLPKEDERAVYFGGHRPIDGKYALRQQGKFIQLHNPLEQNIALVYKDKRFDPNKNIISVKKI